MLHANTATLINPQNGNLAFKIYEFENNALFDHVQRLNYYSIMLITEGEAELSVDFSSYAIAGNSLLFFSPYQPFMIRQQSDIKGMVINFHPDFFCIHKHQKEVSCNGVLFNNVYASPVVTINDQELQKFMALAIQMKDEMLDASTGQYELLLSYLKIFLINASRLKLNQSEYGADITHESHEPFVLQQLKDAIEEHYKTRHAPSDYSAILNISHKALAKITKTHFNKTLTDIITERIIIEAKRELYLTAKPVKQIAYELGFDDEYYFNRFFKKNTDIPPKHYRDTVGFDRAKT